MLVDQPRSIDPTLLTELPQYDQGRRWKNKYELSYLNVEGAP
jgi:hypothetical protein